jgi:hypothetical protein
MLLKDLHLIHKKGRIFTSDTSLRPKLQFIVVYYNKEIILLKGYVSVVSLNMVQERMT